MSETSAFLGFHFARGSREQIAAQILARATQPYGFVTTPNVDFVTRAERDPAIKALYGRAVIEICDSRVLARLARIGGIVVDCYPGSDFVAELLESDIAHTIAVIGPGEDDFRTLAARYPAANLSLIASPARMSPGGMAWSACLDATAEQGWDILLICLGSPKQEWFADALADQRRDRGVAICVGASIDFLTGRQHRAPRWMRSAGIEWLHRLASDPVRLWRRYVIDCPQIFAIFARTLVASPKSGRD